jgi:hypothetical protein
MLVVDEVRRSKLPTAQHDTSTETWQTYEYCVLALVAPWCNAGASHLSGRAAC